MGEVKPAEVSAILRKQLSGFNTESKLEEIGTVLQVGDGIARIYGLNNTVWRIGPISKRPTGNCP